MIRSLPFPLLLILSILSSACHKPQAMKTTSDALLHEKWVQSRERSLRNPEGWLTLVGLISLDPGTRVLGKSEDADISVTGAPAPVCGTFQTTNDGRVFFTPSPTITATINGHAIRPGLRIPMKNDVKGPPDILRVGTLHITHLQRWNKPVLRVRDREAETLRNFIGVDRYPLDPQWIIPARFKPAPPGTHEDVKDVTGHISQQSRAGTLTFELGGKPCQLHATAEGDQDLFVVFGDETNGHETYGGGRFVNVPAPDQHGMTTIDFNRAYLPPCCFTPYATCPVPGKENILHIPITAGEQKATSPNQEKS